MTDEATKLPLESADLVKENIEALCRLFPEVRTEGGAGAGIDFDKLREILGDYVADSPERYAFTWPGKRDAIRQSQTPSTATLRPRKDKSVDWDTTKNLYIEGDNLEVLKLLQRSYHGKIKMIYIDPPYNTGNDFVYNDKFGDPIENYKQQTGQESSANPETDGRYHSNWCNMMYPRLRLARELLREDGVIFISIDDHEVKNLRSICDEVFGENCFIAQALWQKRTSPDMRKRFSTGHEYVLIYVRMADKVNEAIGLLPLSDADREAYKNPDNDPRGPWVSSDFTAQGFRPNQMYAITTPSGAVYTPPEGTCWKNIESEYLQQASEGRFWYGKDGSAMPRRKTYLAEREGRNCWTWWTNKEVGHTQEASKELKSLFPDHPAAFDFPKPTRLLSRIISIGAHNGGIVLDFFSGSATTAHAVMKLNSNDEGHRRFIMVQLPEIHSPKTDTVKTDYHTICDIGEERIRRAGQKIKSEVDEANRQLEFGAEPKPVPDIGFRVLSLDSSNMKTEAETPAGTWTAEALYDDAIKDGRSKEDVLFEVMLKWGLDLSLPIEPLELDGYRCWSVAKGELICCMDEGLTVPVMERIAALEDRPRRVLILDAILDDTLKLNAEAIFGRASADGDEIELRTV